MGFGYLLVGYILAFVFSLGKVYFFQDIIGALVMLMGLSQLAQYGKNFARATWVNIAYLLVSTVRALLMMLRLIRPESIWTTLFALLIPAVSLVLQFFLFAGIFYLAQQVELEREAQKAKGTLVRILSYYILHIIASLVTPHLGVEIANIINLVITVYGLVVLIMNVAFLHTCYCRICLKGQESGERVPSKFEWVNRMNEKADKMLDGAFLRPEKEKKKPAETPEPGYLRVKRKKQGKRKK